MAHIPSLLAALSPPSSIPLGWREWLGVEWPVCAAMHDCQWHGETQMKNDFGLDATRAVFLCPGNHSARLWVSQGDWSGSKLGEVTAQHARSAFVPPYPQ